MKSNRNDIEGRSSAPCSASSDTPRTDSACAYLIRQNQKDPGYADMARYSVLGVQSLLATSKSLERELTSEKWRVRALEDVAIQCLAMAEAWEDSDGGRANELIAALRNLLPNKEITD